MFQIDFSRLVCYYLTGMLFVFFFAQRLCAGRRRDEARHAVRQVWQCAVCLHTYFDPKPSRISACPVCGTLNKREPKEEEVSP